MTSKKIENTVYRLLSGIVLIYILLQLFAENNWYHASQLALFGDFPRAKPLYDKASLLLQNNSNFLFNYGAESILAGRADEALLLLKRAKRTNVHSNVYNYLGDAYTKLGMLDEAEQHYRQAIRI